MVPIEGFVVRGKKVGGEEGEAFFWKVKYDEPYLMYREWREVTRKILDHARNEKARIAHYIEKGQKNQEPGTGLDRPEATVLPFEINLAKLRNEESRLYVWWVTREIEERIEKFESWKVGRGIIRTREEFLEWRDTEDGIEAARSIGAKIRLQEEEEGKEKAFDRTLIVPIAVQGCGKSFFPSVSIYIIVYCWYVDVVIYSFYDCRKNNFGNSPGEVIGMGSYAE